MTDRTEYTLRDAIRERTPRWLWGRFGQRLTLALGSQIDALLDGLIKGVRVRFPGKYGYESLPLIARDRILEQGLDESNADFAERLRTWRQDKRTKCNAYSLMRRLHSYLIRRHTGVWLEVILNSGTTYKLENDGTVVMPAAGTWDWDSEPTWWSRAWVVIHGANWVSEGTFADSGLIGDGGTIGSDMTPEESNGIRAIVADETPPHATCVRVIVVLDEGEWAAHQPDGTWKYWRNRHPVGLLFMDGR